MAKITKTKTRNPKYATVKISISNFCIPSKFQFLSFHFQLPCAPHYYGRFAHLKKLILHIKTTPSVSFLDVASLLKSVPNVEKIHFEVSIKFSFSDTSIGKQLLVCPWHVVLTLG